MRGNRPSHTALQIVRAISYLAVEPEIAALLPPGLAATNERLLRSAGLMSERQLRRLERPRVRRMLAWVDSRTAGGQLLFVGLRKRLLADEAEAAIARGCRQMLVIGGGLDTLAWRVAAQHDTVTVVELDHPASAARKRTALAALGPQPPNLRLVPLDLATGSLAGALAAIAGWDTAAATFAVAEGVFMYVTPAGVETTLRQLHDAVGAGSAIVFSYVRRDVRGVYLLGRFARLAAASLALRGEPIRWGVGDGELAPLLESTGWRLEVERFDLRERYLAPAGLGDRPLADIERYALAQWT